MRTSFPVRKPIRTEPDKFILKISALYKCIFVNLVLGLQDVSRQDAAELSVRQLVWLRPVQDQGLRVRRAGRDDKRHARDITPRRDGWVLIDLERKRQIATGERLAILPPGVGLQLPGGFHRAVRVDFPGALLN